MKSKTFTFIIVILFLGGAYLIATKLNLFSKISLSSKNSEEVSIPKNEWDSVLVGTWKFKQTYIQETTAWEETGNVEFKANGKFKKYISIKYYESMSPTDDMFYDGYLLFKGGGSIEGKWSVDSINGSWSEICEPEGYHIYGPEVLPQKSVNPEYNILVDYMGYNAYPFGNYTHEVRKGWVEKFTPNEIFIKGINYVNNEKIKITLTRQ